MTLKANGGTLREGAYIKDLAFVPSEHVKRQNEALGNDETVNEWAGEVSIGTPPVNFLIKFDSTYPRCTCRACFVLICSS